ncbi:MFS transporter [Rhodobacteraceae bacterium NNCM2]|nr:MFS transporter [Coraliihabitans acroporae]
MADTERTTQPRTIFAATSGNVLEWYDFTAYSYLAPILGRVFFPSGDHTASLLSAFAVLAVGYLARPIGGLIFGQLGDRIGRKPALLISVIMMGAGSLLIGLLPTYEQAGVVASILLVLIRVVQGMAVAGEYTTSGVLLVEQARPGSRGFIGGWIAFAMMLGCVAGSGVPALLSTFMTEAEVEQWGWRIPFLIGSVVALYSAFLRVHLSETALAPAERQAAPAVAAIRDHWRLIVQMVMLLLPSAVIYFVIFVYAASYMTDQMHFTTSQALDITTINLVVIAVLSILLGRLSDRIGRQPLFLFGAIGTLVLAWPLWWMMHQPNIYMIFLGQLGFSVFNAIGWALSITVLVEISPRELRCSVVAIGYNICLAIFGGTTPMVATYLVARTGDDYTPVYYVMVATVISLFVITRLNGLIARQEAVEPA